MAKLRSTLVLLFAASAARAADANLPPPEAIGAYRNFWSHFEDYEEKAFQESREKLEGQQHALTEKERAALKQLTEAELAHLEAAEKRYREHAANHPQAANLPYVYLNLAQILNRMAEHHARENPEKARTCREQALLFLGELTTKFPEFANREETLYLSGFAYAGLDKHEAALRAWTELAQSAKKSLYGVHGALAVGDDAFAKDQTKTAQEYYQKAADLLAKIDVPNKARETQNVRYRLMWVTYRNAEINKAIEHGLYVLGPGAQEPSRERRRRMTADAVDIVANSLFENDDMKRTLAVLGKAPTEAAAVGMRVMTHYRGAGALDKVATIGEWAAREHPTARETPAILTLLAGVYQEQGQEDRRLEALEKLALFLPTQSLWRTRYRDDFEAVKKMEQEALSAAEQVAGSYYTKGMAGGHPGSFASAATYYTVLLEFDGTNPKAEDYRLKVAHSYFFADKLALAEEAYEKLRAEQNLSATNLQVVSYQLVMTREKRWRHAFGMVLVEKREPTQDPIVIERLRKLEEGVEDYANRFPGEAGKAQNRAVDLLLVGAAANRDHENYAQASKFWERAMVSVPTPGQRAVAARGMLMATVKSGTNTDVMRMAENFLAVDDIVKTDPALATEVKGVLSQAARRESDALSEKGEMGAAAQVLLSTAQRTLDLPDRERFQRDGAYFLALAGDWDGARQTADKYLSDSTRQYAGDMTYVKARALEYQLRLADAATAYLAMGAFPDHGKTAASLERAEKLALADGKPGLAGKAAVSAGDLAQKPSEKVAAYSRAVEHFENDHQPALALAAAKRRLDASPNPSEKLRSEVMLAQAEFDEGREQQALAAMQKLASRAESDQVDEKTRQEVQARANFALAEERREQFDDFSIIERRGTLQDNLQAKMRMFEDLAKHYESVAQTAHPALAAQSRFRLGESAEKLADEIRLASAKEADLPNKTREELLSTASRLGALAKRAYGANGIAAGKDDVWTKKSRLKLTGMSGIKPPQEEDPMPAAIGSNLPSQWSL